ncbi:MAG: response regulator [Gemmatimonadetes bacterium]|nr:response regulator [Gemmatimonadota bacterium]
MNVLLIDESDSSARGALECLGAAGEPVRYEWAPDLASAVQRLDEPGIDIVLMGLVLPDAWGSEALEKVRAFSGAAPIVVMVAAGDQETEVKCRSLGAAEVVSEDELTPPVLGRVLRYALERSRLLNAMRNLAMVDELTDLYTLRGLTELGQHHLRVAIRMAQNVLLMYVGTDASSDAATAAAASVLSQAFRASDVVARIGSGAFAVLAMDADAQAAGLLEHRFREGIQRAILEGRTPSIKLRVGHAGLSELPRASVEDLLQLAKSRATGAAPAQEEPASA